jgi:hypothetical protein
MKNLHSNINENNNQNLSQHQKKYSFDDISKDIIVYTYMDFCQLKTGNKFGDMALNAINQKRTATIISNEIMHFGIFEKKEFKKIINDVNDKMKKKDIKIIQRQKVFSSINLNVFQWNYFNLFVNKKFKRGEKITIESSEYDRIFVIKEGLFEITIKKNNLEFVELIKELGGNISNTIKEEELKYGIKIKIK